MELNNKIKREKAKKKIKCHKKTLCKTKKTQETFQQKHLQVLNWISKDITSQEESLGSSDNEESDGSDL